VLTFKVPKPHQDVFTRLVLDLFMTSDIHLKKFNSVILPEMRSSLPRLRRHQNPQLFQILSDSLK